jgi:small subunit ribosomal protein S15
MAFTTADRQRIISEYRRSENDVGSTEVQVSLLTHRILYLTDHFKAFTKDLHSRRGLQIMVNSRRKLLKYLKRTNSARYYDLIKRLELRDSC